MDPQPTEQNVVVPGAAAAPPPPPTYVGNTGIVDRSNQPATVYPQPASPASPGVSTGGSTPSEPADTYQEASSAFAELTVLASGGASAVGFFVIAYFTKNAWATGIISAALAITAMFLSIRDYRTSRRIGPLTVIGLSAATISLVFIANDLILQALLRTTLAGY